MTKFATHLTTLRISLGLPCSTARKWGWENVSFSGKACANRSTWYVGVYVCSARYHYYMLPWAITCYYELYFTAAYPEAFFTIAYCDVYFVIPQTYSITYHVSVMLSCLRVIYFLRLYVLRRNGLQPNWFAVLDDWKTTPESCIETMRWQ